MDLIDFLEGAYQGGRLLYLLKQHDKKVKDRYKRIKFKRYEDGFVSTTAVQIQETQRKTQELQREYNEILRKRVSQRRASSLFREMQQVVDMNPKATTKSISESNRLFDEAMYQYYTAQGGVPKSQVNLSQNEIKERYESTKRFSTALGQTVSILATLRF